MATGGVGRERGDGLFAAFDAPDRHGSGGGGPPGLSNDVAGSPGSCFVCHAAGVVAYEGGFDAERHLRLLGEEELVVERARTPEGMGAHTVPWTPVAVAAGALRAVGVIDAALADRVVAEYRAAAALRRPPDIHRQGAAGAWTIDEGAGAGGGGRGGPLRPSRQGAGGGG